ncbi:hypothetical protein BGZ61DRAFT_529925 [Ilyonectria robusta]|uniref:uncharacterized protein n=1 Tax=Ilyonectria robusta TaxID=1079257 RepID=UPI001E8E0AE4|nr:uncharacterized protein BGZ61DRAFT_529925 [Ilyonectria robusta]KAH8729782.1 hypothetical protein BGZ61DRAFT_529925 [Ilyonectria robusta]
MGSTNSKSSSPCLLHYRIQRSALEVLILGRGNRNHACNNCMALRQAETEPHQPPSSTVGETPQDKTLPMDHVLVKGQKMYFIVTRPAEPTRALSREQDRANLPLRNRLGKFLGSLFDGQDDEPSFLLKQMAVTDKSRVYTTQIGPRTKVVKLFNEPLDANNELAAHIRVYNKLKEHWPAVQNIVVKDSQFPIPKVPRPGPTVFQRKRLGTSTTAEGFMMEYIHPLHPHHCRALIKKYLDPRLHKAAFEHAGFSGMRLSVRMGEIRPELDRQTGELQDRPVFFDQLWKESSSWVPCWVVMMGATLAIIHWACGLDAKGVEFQMGTYKNHNFLWLSDFGDCTRIEPSSECATSHMVDTIMDNSTWPRPATARSLSQLPDPDRVLPQMWAKFRCAYLKTSAAVLCERNTYIRDGCLPLMFISRLEARWELEAEERQI